MNKLNTPTFWDKMNRLHRKKLTHSDFYNDKIRWVTKHLVNVNGNMLDIGFGNAHLERTLYKYNKNLVISGIDISPWSVSKAQNKLRKANFILGDFNNYKFDELFNFVVALDVLEHLDDLELDRALRKIRNLLSTDGFVIISVPVNENDIDFTQNRHIQRFSVESISKTLHKNGFRINSIKTITAFKKQYVLKNILNRFLKFKSPNVALMKLTVQK